MTMVLTRDQEALPTVARGARPVQADLTFITPQLDKPRFLSQAYTGGAPEFRFETESHEVRIEDLRPLADRFTLDSAGFALRTWPTAVGDLYDDIAVEHHYFDEARQHLTREFGASRVVIFDVTRRSDGQTGAPNRDGTRSTASRIHVDYTAKSGPHRARDTLGAEDVDAALARGARIVQLNLWRPISGPVQRSPLALALANSIEPFDLVATDQIFPDRTGEIYHLAYNPGQRWYYVPEMTRDEVLLIKGWDSAADGRAQFTPHTAFTLPDQSPSAPSRESIEIRTFIVIG